MPACCMCCCWPWRSPGKRHAAPRDISYQPSGTAQQMSSFNLRVKHTLVTDQAGLARRATSA